MKNIRQNRWALMGAFNQKAYLKLAEPYVIQQTLVTTTSVTSANRVAAKSNNYTYWALWLISLLLISFVFGITLDIAPFLHKDEFTTVELGRAILSPETDWSLTWLTSRSEPVFVWFYIGPVLQEFSYQTFGEFGPRISSLIGALVAASLVVNWLLAADCSKIAAFILGLVFLLDPLFVQAYTLGRVDSWAIALCIASCWLIRSIEKGKLWEWKIIGAAALAVTAFFTWPSAVFIFPLIFLEIAFFLVYRFDKKNWFRPFLTFGVAAMIFVVLLLLPFSSLFIKSINNIVQGLQINLHSGPGLVDKELGSDVLSKFIALLRILKFTPLVSTVAIIALIIRRQFSLALAFAVTVLILVFTVVYMHRVLYLLPYFILSLAALYNKKYYLSNTRMNTTVLSGILVLMMVWSAGLSLVARTGITFMDKSEKKRTLIHNAALQLVGAGEQNVFLYAPEFYYSGRQLGWKMYTPYTPIGEALSANEMTKVLPKVDYFIMAEWELTPEFNTRLLTAGLHDQGIFQLYDEPLEKDNGVTTNIRRLRNLYFIFRKPYGPYRVYARHTNITPDTQNKNFHN